MSNERHLDSESGWLMLFANVVLFLATVVSFLRFIASDGDDFPYLLLFLAFLVASVLVSNGFFTLQPGQARACVLFGEYVGTVRDEGLRWANPFYAKSLGANGSSKVSTRARTLNGEPLKVNDKMGNPIEIATVVVWRVQDTAKALFDVDDYESFVAMQTETALRHVASVYAYDHMEDDDENADSITLRSNIEEVSAALKEELSIRFAPAGVAVDDARLTHLAYAPEIAQAMLRRQQAEAVIAARKKIVEGAVSMVDMAIERLSEESVVELDNERRAQFVTNLMVVLCGESEAQPVVNAGNL